MGLKSPIGDESNGSRGCSPDCDLALVDSRSRLLQPWCRCRVAGYNEVKVACTSKQREQMAMDEFKHRAAELCLFARHLRASCCWHCDRRS